MDSNCIVTFTFLSIHKSSLMTKISIIEKHHLYFVSTEIRVSTSILSSILNYNSHSTDNRFVCLMHSPCHFSTLWKHYQFSQQFQIQHLFNFIGCSVHNNADYLTLLFLHLLPFLFKHQTETSIALIATPPSLTKFSILHGYICRYSPYSRSTVPRQYLGLSVYTLHSQREYTGLNRHTIQSYDGLQYVLCSSTGLKSLLQIDVSQTWLILNEQFIDGHPVAPTGNVGDYF